MHIRLLIVLLFSGLLINVDAIANDALSSVRIVEGITQQRPSQYTADNRAAVCVELSR